METIVIEEKEVAGRKKEQERGPEAARRGNLQLRGSTEWLAYIRKWCEEGPPFMEPGDLVEWAIAELAKQQGRPKPPRR